MNELLYIDGQLVDLGEEVNITLNYKSNMLTELNKIVGNNSYTIKLPKTNRNLSIIGCADVAGVVSSFPRTYHSVRYFRNGVELIADGKAVLMSVSDTIEVVLLWGLSSGLYKLEEYDKDLNSFENVDDYIMWEATNSKSAYDGMAQITNMEVRYGLRDGETLAAIHPSVRVAYVLELIGNYYGLLFDFPEERKSFVNSLMIPLLTRNGGYANSYRSLGGVVYSELTADYAVVKYGDDFDLNFERIMPDYTGSTHFISFTALVGGKLTIRPTFKSHLSDIAVYHGSGTDKSKWDKEYLSYYFEEDNAVVEDVYIYNEPLEIELSEGDSFGINLSRCVYMGVNNSYFQFEIGKNEIQIGDKFPIVENLPQIGCVDFIKSLAALGGMFCVPSSDGNTIKFVTFDALADRSNAVDWSDKLIPRDHTNRPRSISYSLDDFARRNNMLWEEDDSVGITTANGAIYVDDVTLDEERDAVELPFAATDTRGGKAMIRLYEYNDDGEPELQSVEPRILVETDVDGYSTGTFDGLYWNTLIAEHYGAYQKAVKSPVVLTESVRLDELSLRDLDVSVPVYLRQYGKYYAIVELKAPSSGVCECKLLQLD